MGQMPNYGGLQRASDQTVLCTVLQRAAVIGLAGSSGLQRAGDHTVLCTMYSAAAYSSDRTSGLQRAPVGGRQSDYSCRPVIGPEFISDPPSQPSLHSLGAQSCVQVVAPKQRTASHSRRSKEESRPDRQASRRFA